MNFHLNIKLCFREIERSKKEEGLNSQHAYQAHKFLKNGKNKCDLDPDEIGEGEDDTGDSEDVSNFIVSDCDDLNDTAGSKSARKKKGMGKLKSMKGKVKDKKEFIGWGSRMLIEFLKYIGKDTSKEFSEHDVTSIIIEYCREKQKIVGGVPWAEETSRILVMFAMRYMPRN